MNFSMYAVENKFSYNIVMIFGEFTHFEYLLADYLLFYLFVYRLHQHYT